MTFAEIERTIGDFGRRARDGKLTVAEMTSGTFTISNGGVYGSPCRCRSSTRRNPRS